MSSSKSRQKKETNWAERSTFVIAIAGLFFVAYQLLQSNKHKRWDNYNAMNAAYHSLYDNVYDGSYPGLLKKYADISSLNEKELAWVRAYFDLYAEEYWLHQKCLIPNDMFGKQIDEGVNLNLREHPLMVSGYKYWREKGAFRHPENFIPFVDEKISCLEDVSKNKEIASCPAGAINSYIKQKWFTCLF